MKKYILIALLILTVPFSVFSQVKQAYFNQSSRYILPPGEAKGVICLLPYTTGTSEELYRYIKQNIPEEDYIILLPPGRPLRNHYLPNFIQFVQWYEGMLLRDLDVLFRSNPDTKQKVILMGYSLGGDLSWALSQRNPDLVSHALVMGSRCSYPYKTNDVEYSFAIGEWDADVRKNGLYYAHKLTSSTGEPVLQSYKGGHELPSAGLIGKLLNSLIGREQLKVASISEEVKKEELSAPEEKAANDAYDIHESLNVRIKANISRGITALYYLPPGPPSRKRAQLLWEGFLDYGETMDIELPPDGGFDGILVCKTATGYYGKTLEEGKGTFAFTIFSKAIRF